MRSLPIVEGGHYHVYNRGVGKQILFHDDADYARFLFLLLYMQAPISIPQINRYIKNYLKTSDFLVANDLLNKILEQRVVEVFNFCIMQNHFHITVHSLKDGAVGIYMQKVCNAYAKYFNTKYEKTGHVFQGIYKVRQCFDDNDLVYLSAYIHKNPIEIGHWKEKIIQYPWSSYQDMNYSRWGNLLNIESISSGFNSFEEYQEYVASSGAKEQHEL